MKENRFLVATADNDLLTTLAQFTAAEFEQVVLANASRHRRNTALWEALLAPAVIERTHSALADAVQRNAAAMAARRQDEPGGDAATADVDDYVSWRRRASSFNHLVQGALREVNKRRQQMGRDEDLRAAERYRQQIRDLALAIAGHERAVLNGGAEPSPHDVQLWAYLDSVCLPHGSASTPTSLRALVAGQWYPSTV